MNSDGKGLGWVREGSGDPFLFSYVKLVCLERDDAMDARDIYSDFKFQKYVVDAVIPFPVMLKRAGLPGYSYDGKCFCPFHENYETPAAKLFKDKNGDTLFCFSEQKIYKPSDVIRVGLLNASMESLFKNIWAQLNEQKREKLFELYDSPVDYIPQAWKDNKSILDMFKTGDVTFEQHLIHIRDSLD